MALGGFTLADRLGARAIPCRVKGCTRTWLQISNKALSLRGGESGSDGADGGLCEPCANKLRGIKDVERRCDRPGCAGTWTWPVAAQLEAFATRRPAPKALCAACEGLLATLEDKEAACNVPGCARKAVITRRAQLLAMDAPAASNGQPNGQGDAPAANAENAETGGRQTEAGVTFTGPFCSPCEPMTRKLKDRAVTCGITGCSRKWTWRADDQIQAFAAGKPPEPPRRMCGECRAEFGKLVDREVRCRTSGCKNTWTWARTDQLDACVADKAAPKAPQRMCQRCFDVWHALKDVERPCRKAGCKGTWTDKRGAQLARIVRNKTGDPYPRYCAEHERDLGDLQDREIACKTDGCGGTWTWTREQQLAAGVLPRREAEPESEPAPAPESAQASDGAESAAAEPATEVTTAEPQSPERQEPAGKKKRRRNRNKRRREPQAPERRCSACAEFLAQRKTQEIPCTQCNTPIYWPPESQLQTHLGNWAAPALCGACKRDATEAARVAAREALRAQALDKASANSAEAPAAETDEASANGTEASAPDAADTISPSDPQ